MKKQQDDHVERSCCLCHMFCTSRMLPTAWRAEHAVFCFYVQLRSFSDVHQDVGDLLPIARGASRVKAGTIQSLVSQSVRVRTEHTAVHRGEPIVENPPEERCRLTLLSGQTPHISGSPFMLLSLQVYTLYIFINAACTTTLSLLHNLSARYIVCTVQHESDFYHCYT